MATEKAKAAKSGMRLLEAPNAFGVLVRTARLGWTTAWRVMMAELAPSSKSGAYVRPESTLAAVDKFDGVEGMTLYEGVACGWCHRTMLARTLLGLNNEVKAVRVTPGDDGLWRLRNGLRLRDVYPTSYRGRYTAPLLMADNGFAVCNESALILQVFHARAGRRTVHDVEVCLRPCDEGLCERIYADVNDGVYRCGFATSQAAYEAAERRLFGTLDHCEELLGKSRFLCSADTITEADIRLFPTVWRFDAVYAHLFKARRKSITADYPNISAWLRDIYRLPGVAETCDLDATRRNYYENLFPLNPGGIVPVPPELDMTPTVDRTGLGIESKVTR